MEINIPSREQTKPARTKLTDTDRQALLHLVKSEGYNVMLKLMEMECVLQDARLVAVPVDKPEEIVAEHRITVAKWEFLAELQRQVKHEVNELMKPVDAGPAQSAEDKEIAAILDPTAPQ